MNAKEIVEKIEKLTRANVNVGYYDYLRYREVQKPVKSLDRESVYTAAKEVRNNNEIRSALKNDLDGLLSFIAKNSAKR